MAVNIARLNPDRKVYFFTFKDERVEISTAFKGLCSGLMEFSELTDSGRLTFGRIDLDRREMFDLIEQVGRDDKRSVILIDNIQRMRVRLGKRFFHDSNSLDELYNDLQDLALKTKLPIVISESFVGDVKQDTEMMLDKVGDVERIDWASKLTLGLWNGNLDGSITAGKTEMLLKVLKSNYSGLAGYCAVLKFDHLGRLTQDLRN